MLGGIWSVERGITGLMFLQEGGFVVDNAIPAFARDEIAVLLLVYMLICAGD
jgi:hypothetical protein